MGNLSWLSGLLGITGIICIALASVMFFFRRSKIRRDNYIFVVAIALLGVIMLCGWGITYFPQDAEKTALVNKVAQRRGNFDFILKTNRIILEKDNLVDLTEKLHSRQIGMIARNKAIQINKKVNSDPEKITEQKLEPWSVAVSAKKSEKEHCFIIESNLYTERGKISNTEQIEIKYTCSGEDFFGQKVEDIELISIKNIK